MSLRWVRWETDCDLSQRPRVVVKLFPVGPQLNSTFIDTVQVKPLQTVTRTTHSYWQCSVVIKCSWNVTQRRSTTCVSRSTTWSCRSTSWRFRSVMKSCTVTDSVWLWLQSSTQFILLTFGCHLTGLLSWVNPVACSLTELSDPLISF